MITANHIYYFLLFGFAIATLSCSKNQSGNPINTAYTKTDSLTETYLAIQDSLLHAWNVMAWDEKEKVENMHGILQLMQKKEGFDSEQLAALAHRLDQLNRIRFTQKSLANSFVIEEYDFASNSLVSEIMSLAEADPEFIKNEKAQKLVDKVKIAEQRVMDYREAYDKVAMRYNLFIERNDKYLQEIDKSHTGEKKALFQATAQ